MTSFDSQPTRNSPQRQSGQASETSVDGRPSSAENLDHSPPTGPFARTGRSHGGVSDPPTGEKAEGKAAEELRPGLEPLRFGLKTLFVLVTAVAILISLWSLLGPAIGVMLLVFLLVLFAHIAGNAIGTKLRDSGTETQRTKRRATETCEVRVEHYAPVTRLSHRVPLGRLMQIATVFGAVLGGVAGTFVLYRMYPETTTAASLAVGGVASAAFGGFWAFWIGSLAKVFLGAWWQAHRHENDRR